MLGSVYASQPCPRHWMGFTSTSDGTLYLFGGINDQGRLDIEVHRTFLAARVASWRVQVLSSPAIVLPLKGLF